MTSERPELHNQGYQELVVENYEGCFVYKPSVEYMHLVKDVDVEDGDIYVSTFPKSGTTWMQQIVYLVCNGANIEEAKKEKIDKRFPYVELTKELFEMTLATPHPRMVKTHLSYNLLPSEIQKKNAKVIYVARNPKDTLVSFYFYTLMFKNFQYLGSLQDFLNMFLDDDQTVTYGPWWKHVLDYWEHRNDKNIFFTTYEEMSEDLPGCVRRVVEFLEKDLTDEQIKTISDNCTFDSMSKDKSVNYNWDPYLIQEKGKFMRKGKVGDWKNHLSSEMSAAIDKYVEENLGSSGLKFVYE